MRALWPLVAIASLGLPGPAEAVQPAGPTYNPPPPETEEEREHRKAKAAAWQEELDRRQVRFDEEQRVRREQQAKEAHEQHVRSRRAALACSRCGSTGWTNVHKNGRPSKRHNCPECKDARKAWKKRYPEDRI